MTRWCMKEVYLDCECPLKGMHEGKNLGVCRVWHQVDIGRNNRKSCRCVSILTRDQSGEKRPPLVGNRMREASFSPLS